MSTRRVYNNNLILLFPKESYAFFCYLDRVCFVTVSEERALDLRWVLFQLFESTGSKRVSSNEAYSPTFLNEVIGVFSTSGGFTWALKPNKHDNIWFASLHFWHFILRRQHCCQFFNYLLLNQFLKIRCANIPIIHLQHYCCFNIVSELVDVVDINIRL